MSTMAENDNSNNASWLKQRTTIFNNSNTTANKPAPKVVDKELARLKNIGAVSSVWSNKFVQEDNSGGTTENKHNSPPPLSPRQRFMLNNIDISPRPNANYNPGSNTFRSSMTSPPPQQATSPRSPAFNARARTLSGNNKKLADDVAAALEQQQSNNNNFGYFSKASMSSLDLDDSTTENIKSTRSSIASSTTTTSVPPSPINQVSSDGLFTPPASINKSRSSNTSSVHSTSIDEAASLWFQCETLKTQYAQSNARLNRATQDIDFYKRQLEQQAEVSRDGIAAAVEEKEKESLRVRQLAELIVKQDKLLGEYEINLDCLTRLTDEATYLEESQAEMNSLRQELSSLTKKKLEMEGAISALSAELDMSRSQMRLMMAVSTEIQNEFATYKEKIDAEVRELLSRKNREHQVELQALQDKLAVNETTERSVISQDNGVREKEIATHVAAATAAAAATTALTTADHKKSLDSLREQIDVMTEDFKAKEEAMSKTIQSKEEQFTATLEEKDKHLSEALMAKQTALEEKDKHLSEALKAKDEELEEKVKAVSDLENQLKTQKMKTDAQMMELNQTILEKDALLMEFMSSRNNSREVIAAAASMSPSTSIPAASVTNTYYHSNQSEAQLHMSQVRDYMLSSSSDEDEDEQAETLMLSYSTDDEEEEQTLQNNYHQQVANNNDARGIVPQSPAETISSAVSFDSDEEEEKIAEIKRFSYNSVQSATTRPISLTSTTESISSNGRSSMRNSNTPFSIAKETNAANWPMPPPTPPPSEPLPPVPSVQTDDLYIKAEVKATSPVAQMVSNIPPPRRARSKTMARDEAPDMSSYTTSVHQTNEFPRIMQKPLEEESTPVPPPRKDLANINVSQANSLRQEQQHTKWMDDPESEEDDEFRCATTPKQQHQSQQEWIM